jgi:hypothetical protein
MVDAHWLQKVFPEALPAGPAAAELWSASTNVSGLEYGVVLALDVKGILKRPCIFHQRFSAESIPDGFRNSE